MRMLCSRLPCVCGKRRVELGLARSAHEKTYELLHCEEESVGHGRLRKFADS